MGGGWWWARVARLARLRFRGRRYRLSGSAAVAPEGPLPRATARAREPRRPRCQSWIVRTLGSSGRRTRQLSSLGSEMAFWHQESGSSPSCRVIWAEKLPTVSSLLGGLCVVWGGASYAVGLAALRGPMHLSLAGAVAGVGAVLAASLLWACAVGLYMGQLELDVELVPEDDGTASTEGPDEAGRPPPE